MFELRHNINTSDLRCKIHISDLRYNIHTSDLRYSIRISDLRHNIHISDLRYNIHISDLRYNIHISDLRHNIHTSDLGHFFFDFLVSEKYFSRRLDRRAKFPHFYGVRGIFLSVPSLLSQLSGIVLTSCLLRFVEYY